MEAGEHSGLQPEAVPHCGDRGQEGRAAAAPARENGPPAGRASPGGAGEVEAQAGETVECGEAQGGTGEDRGQVTAGVEQVPAGEEHVPAGEEQVEQAVHAEPRPRTEREQWHEDVDRFTAEQLIQMGIKPG